MRDRDVYRFHYADTVKRFMPYHCFDGQLVALKQEDGSFLLRDTYWSDGFDSRTFTEAEAVEQGELTFVCNLDDVDEIDKRQTTYYANSDVFNLSRQHGCYPRFALRKGSRKSPDKMREIIEQQANEARSEIEHAQYRLARLDEFAKKVAAGELDEVCL